MKRSVKKQGTKYFPMIDFTRPDYLKKGSGKQQRIYQVLTQYRVFDVLKDYCPVLVGTFPIEIDIEGSDLDIICHIDPDFDGHLLQELVLSKIVPESTEVTVEKSRIDGENSIVIQFMLEEFPVEIFGQNKPVTEQNAYRHMVAEYKILLEKGNDFKQKITDIKKKGIKTEPAFGILLRLENPYEDLLKL